MHVAIDARTATPHFPGIGRYVSGLARGLAGATPEGRFTVIADRSVEKPLFSLPEEDIIPCSISPFSVRQQTVVPRLLATHGISIYHSPYYLMPYLLSVPTVLTCHDVIPLIFPGYFSLYQRAAFRVAHRLALRAASRVIAVSGTTRDDILRLFGARPDQIEVIPSGVEEEFHKAPAHEIERVRRAHGLPDRYVLYVGTNKPHKNLARLVKAWHLAGRESGLSRTALVIAGYLDDRYPEAQLLISTLDLSERIRLLGPVPPLDLVPLYSGATLFVFPSLYEGFGFPILEAMACGTPVACSDTRALVETAGDGATFFPPSDTRAMASCLAELLADRERLRALAEAGKQRAASFSWKKTASRTAGVYRSAMASGRL